MDADILKVDIAHGVAELMLNKPSKLNAIDPALAERLVEAVAEIVRDPSVNAVVLRGAGRAFMAGGDLKTFHAAGEEAPAAVRRLIEPFHALVRAIRDLRMPVIAAVHGPVAGGGLALALACDVVIASADAVFTPAYLKIGTSPDGGTTWSVATRLGGRRALEWLMLGESMSATEALQAGLINKMVEPDDLAARALELARRIAAGPAEAQTALKRLVWRAATTSFADQLDAEAENFIRLSATADFREGVAAFFERREPRFGV